MLVINRTPNTLTNLTVELSTMGDLRLVERPQSHTIGPLDSRNIRANIKVSTSAMIDSETFFSLRLLGVKQLLIHDLLFDCSIFHLIRRVKTEVGCPTVWSISFVKQESL